MSQYKDIVERVSFEVNYECWVWEGQLKERYPKVWTPLGPKKIHRIAYELRYGKVSNDLELDHTCNNTHCWNPEHLRAVTHLENVRRSRVGEFQLQKTHCPSGHEYTESNTYMYRGTRACKHCRYLHVLRFRGRL